MSTCEKPTSAVGEEAGEGLHPDSPGPTGDTEGTDGGSGGSSGAPSWSAEFKKLRHAFENVVENEDGGMFEFPDQSKK